MNHAMSATASTTMMKPAQNPALNTPPIRSQAPSASVSASSAELRTKVVVIAVLRSKSAGEAPDEPPSATALEGSCGASADAAAEEAHAQIDRGARAVGCAPAEAVEQQPRLVGSVGPADLHARGWCGRDCRQHHRTETDWRVQHGQRVHEAEAAERRAVASERLVVEARQVFRGA